jgi:transposase
VQKYLDDPAAQAAKRTRASKLDPFKDDIERMLETDPKVSAAVICQRLQERGFDGGMTIVRDYLSRVRPNAQAKAAFIRFESEPGVQCQIDWGLCRARHRPHYADIQTMPSHCAVGAFFVWGEAAQPAIGGDGLGIVFLAL